jgi:hypothetical protein
VSNITEEKTDLFLACNRLTELLDEGDILTRDEFCWLVETRKRITDALQGQPWEKVVKNG